MFSEIRASVEDICQMKEKGVANYYKIAGEIANGKKCKSTAEHWRIQWWQVPNKAKIALKFMMGNENITCNMKSKKCCKIDQMEGKYGKWHQRIV